MRNKIIKPVITLSVLAAFSLSVLVCCCALHAAHSSSKNMAAMASDPHQQDSSSKETTHHGYCFLQAPAAEKVKLSAVVMPALDNFVSLPQAMVAFEHYAHQFSFVRTAYGGNLFSRAGPVPLYLQIHSLRL